MLYCPKCGTENSDTTEVCTDCGRAFPRRNIATDAAPQQAADESGRIEVEEQAVAPSPTPEPRTTPFACPTCGTAASESAQFCQRCGKKLVGPDYGSFWLRLVGWVIDAVFIGIVSGVLAALGGSTVSFAGLAIGIVYYVGLNANGGTVGKRAVGLRLENAQTGEDIGYGAALVRYIVAFASAVFLLIGYLWVIWDDKNQTWHDKAAGSVVVISNAR